MPGRGNGSEKPRPKITGLGTRKAKGNKPELLHDNPATSEPAAEVVKLHPTVEAAVKQTVHGDGYVGPEDHRILDEAERLAADAILDDNDGDAPGDQEEIVQALIVKNLPKFAVYRTSLVTFDLWGVTDRQGMDDLLFVTTKSFAPHFEEDVELRRVRFFETVTSPDSVVRLVWCFVPEKSGRLANTWLSSKLAALEFGQEKWATMRSRKTLQQYTFRAVKKQEREEAKYSGRTPAEWIMELKKQGLLVIDTKHDFYKKATDNDE
jgi:hypothetical protein